MKNKNINMYIVYLSFTCSRYLTLQSRAGAGVERTWKKIIRKKTEKKTCLAKTSKNNLGKYWS